MRRSLALIPFALAACSPQGPAREPADPSANAVETEAAAIAGIEDRAEIDALKNRVIALEREVGELKANPQALDLDLLTQRVERLEGAPAGTPPAPPADTRTAPIDTDRAQHAVDDAIAERRAKRTRD